MLGVRPGRRSAAGGALQVRLRECSHAVAPAHGARTGDGEALGVVEDDATLRVGELAHHDVGHDAEELAEVAAPLLCRDGFVATPVDDRTRRRSRIEQRFGVLEDVAVVACHGSGLGRYTPVLDITRNAFAARQCPMSSAVPSAFTRIAWS